MDKPPPSRSDCACLARVEDWGLALHLGLWLGLLLGLWLHWTPAISVGFAITVTNLTGYFFLAGANLAIFVCLVPFSPKTEADYHIRLFVTMGLIVQIWQFFFWIEGAAAN